MKNMPKMLLRLVMVLTLCMALLVNIANAEKVDYKDSSYNFKKINAVLVYDMDFSQVDVGGVLAKSLNEVYWQKASASKLAVLSKPVVVRKMSLTAGQDLDILAASDNESFERIYSEHIGDYADVYIVPKVTQYNSERLYQQPYTTMEKRTKLVKIKDNQGYEQTVTVEYEEPVLHPGYWYTVFYEKVEFHVYDSRTHKEVFSREDYRSRDDDTGKDMYVRICSNFFRDFAKLTK